jgi:hypothetical protein
MAADIATKGVATYSPPDFHQVSWAYVASAVRASGNIGSEKPQT